MRGFRLSIAFLLAGTLTSAEVTAQTPARRQRPIFTQDFRMVAHRGGAALFPENTLEAFRAAAARWPTAVIETDVRLTADGVPVLIHDPTVDRTTNGKGAVAAQPLAELARLDAAYRFSTDGDRTFPSRGRGVRIPTLEEALTALPNTRFQVEIKEGVEAVPPTVAAIQAAQASTRVVLVARRADVLEQVRALAPLVATNFDENAVREIVKLVRGGHPDDRPPPGDMLTAEPRELAAAGFGATEIADLRDGGIPVQGFTIDDPAAMKRLLAEGFTSLVTNRPDLLAEVIAAAPPSAAGAPTTTAAAPAARPRQLPPPLGRHRHPPRPRRSASARWSRWETRSAIRPPARGPITPS
ncbi:MAG: glycerophosphodiester phosphodiesterase family protein [bacterium]